MNSIYNIIKRPIISEKSAALMEVGNRYVFEVDSKANKSQIKDAIKKLFKVDVEKVRTLNLHGKTKLDRRSGGIYKRANKKKAIVTVKTGQKIEFYESGN